ncbi:putative protein kinase RLK-Pelle-LRR-XII-1 family [Helianthus annuus]|uniref:non-specific serine/threonine protein kinase n=1 Tax=Helianthus annuus TaxID=4232 RepID=A0A9K3IM79_HELAN|nr:receptor kinase-like protein Xa21 [Helianthus annuus]XP_021973299.1 receptor kinase-like protein Xa21 [Helianthus annuus]KAF5799398.1 putative protein kinase RLK-Pelle-LRR-XII-1 family [Helianthus annuus]KAJ0563817.1 putative protein kinase RLK-Pelle-LRR-XII-1 family [Helianthus annuus]KAJ0729155.1 putative protein kinase RLK-Pelle-LRR-XII-1 family [Helianthus annuus]KAJ0731892.1 putative protein kinase RLK-Pelle-LRR-XII-1 family [Helianthus annuus]KAJ0905479.1 putative protein kinase RLK-
MNSKQPIVCLSSFSHIHLIFYTLVIFLTSTTISAAYVGQNETDHQALLNIKLMITHDPYGALTSWNSSTHFCDWAGVTCGKRHRRVTYLRLISQGLEGSLSPHVGNLSFLRRLYLWNNSFQGAIPHELGRLSRLRVLSLYTNKFNGVIPANISGCSNLVEIGLSENELVGSIPKEISFLPKLSFLLLQYNKLTGGISPFLGNITTMVVFATHGNPLGGSIPDTLSHWKNLEQIYCSHCNLSGTIAPMYNLSLLTEVRFTNNQLTGSLPLALGTMLPQLVSLYLWGNQLTGPLPPTISNCSRLSDLQMNKNKFRGKLTIDFSKLRDIYFITIGSNNFGSKEIDEMKFINSLENCTKLKYLDISDCNFQGVLPSSIGNLSDQLSYLSLELNQLHGNLPLSIGNLAGVSSLYLATNHFTGSIPSTIGNLQTLQVLDLHKNQLLGRIPDTIGNLSLLITLSLSSNKLEGAIPSSLGNCRRLLELDLGDNRLNGKIPTRLLQLSSLSKTLNLSQNNLFGSLPMEVGYLKMLSALDLSYNNLSGNIPSGLGDCDSLTRLILKGNLFQGIMPSSLSSLKGLLELDISYNNLSGQIPKFLEQLKLEHLNLSYNDFEGQVPMLGVFSNESAFSVFGNSRLCGGLTELGLRRCKEMKKQTKRFPLFVIVILVASTLFSIICLAYVCCKKKIKRQLSQSSKSSGFLKVSYKQLFKATNGFSEANLIGNGGFSSVYKGILNEDDDRYVAIKVLHLQNRGAQRSFMRECEVWRNIRHRNVLRVITSCSSVDFQGNDFKALVYEFMPKGSLHDWLHSSESTSRLNLLQIINILMDVACALDYIHNQCIPAVVHGDLKPSNILLDDDMVAHIGDFGLARFLGTTSYQTNSTMNRGTIGYIAPEYGIGNEMTSSGDIYSFGILLLEVMTGKKPTDDIFQDGLSLHKFASMSLPDHVTNVIDVNIVNTYQEKETATKNKVVDEKKLKECLASTIKIGVSCSVDSPQQRMDIKNVVRELLHILNALQDI